MIKAAGLVLMLVTVEGIALADQTPRTIDDVFHAALKRSETVSNQEEVTFQAGETHTQALGSLLPNLSGSAYFYHENQPTSFGLSNLDQKQSKVTATQPVFIPQAYPGLKETDLTLKSEEQASKQSRITLFQNVVTEYFLVLAAERDIANLQKESQMYIQRIKDLQAWVNIGRARPADVTQIQA